MLSVEIVSAVTHDPSFVVGPPELGRMFGRSRWWGLRLLREWWSAQQHGGPVRVFRRDSGHLYTTLGVLDQHMPRRRDDALERWRASIDGDIDEAFRRLAEVERAIGRRR
jgi:hypothetical protein